MPAPEPQPAVPVPPSGEVTRGLVLGGGGITGIAWETGLLTGLHERGIDLTAADVVVGTSAGSVVGAQVRSATSLAELYDRQTTPPRPGGPPASIGPAVLAVFVAAALRSRGDGERMGRLLGRYAVRRAAAGRTPSLGERFEAIEDRLTSRAWPDRPLRITAVDAATGVLRVLDGSDAGVDLLTAVAASCAVPGVYPPVPVGGSELVDGGARSVTNADLAADCGRVVVLAPTDLGRGPLRSASDLLGDVPHVVVTPDAGSRSAIGRNVLDPAARVGSARAGHAQAAREADRIAALWA